MSIRWVCACVWSLEKIFHPVYSIAELNVCFFVQNYLDSEKKCGGKEGLNGSWVPDFAQQLLWTRPWVYGIRIATAVNRWWNIAQERKGPALASMHHCSRCTRHPLCRARGVHPKLLPAADVLSHAFLFSCSANILEVLSDLTSFLAHRRSSNAFSMNRQIKELMVKCLSWAEIHHTKVYKPIKVSIWHTTPSLQW